MKTDEKTPIRNLCELFLRITERFSSLPALQYKLEGKWKNITYKEYRDQVRVIASFFKKHVTKDRNCIGILASNRPEWVISDIAIYFSCCISIPLYPTLQPSQIHYILDETETELLVVENKEQFDKIQEIQEKLPHLKTIVVIDPYGIDLRENVFAFSEILNQGTQDLGGSELDLEGISQEIKTDDIASIVYTSGTTGISKGVMLSHGNFLSNTEGVHQVFKFSTEDSVLSFLPLSHAFERTATHYTCNLKLGIRISFAESIEQITSNILEVSPTILVTVPRMLEKVYMRIISQIQTSSSIKKWLFEWALKVGHAYHIQNKDRDPGLILSTKYRFADKLVFQKIKNKLGGRIRLIVSGGAPLEPQIAQFLVSCGLTICEGYGLTETSPVITANRVNNWKLGTVGLPLPNVHVKIADDGEILAKGTNLMKGYFKHPKLTEEVFDSDGWFKTGDIGYLDEDGFLKITDRKKEILVTSGGKNIAPQPIENMLKMNPFISNVMIMGDNKNFISALISPDFDQLEKFANERSIIYQNHKDLVKNADIREKFSEIISECISELPRYEQVKRFEIVPDSWSLETGELTPTLKLKRRIIFDKYRRLIETIYN